VPRRVGTRATRVSRSLQRSARASEADRPSGSRREDGQIAAPAAADARVTPAELQSAALVFAQALREHVAEGLARGQLETVLSGAACLEHLRALPGPPSPLTRGGRPAVPRSPRGRIRWETLLPSPGCS
jgi:hypothetical protein